MLEQTYSEELHRFYRSSKIVRAIKSRGLKREAYEFSTFEQVDLQKEDFYEDLSLDGRTIFEKY